jgi:hypothetical protein
MSITFLVIPSPPTIVTNTSSKPTSNLILTPQYRVCACKECINIMKSNTKGISYCCRSCSLRQHNLNKKKAKFFNYIFYIIFRAKLNKRKSELRNDLLNFISKSKNNPNFMGLVNTYSKVYL